MSRPCARWGSRENCHEPKRDLLAIAANNVIVKEVIRATGYSDGHFEHMQVYETRTMLVAIIAALHANSVATNATFVRHMQRCKGELS